MWFSFSLPVFKRTACKVFRFSDGGNRNRQRLLFCLRWAEPERCCYLDPGAIWRCDTRLVLSPCWTLRHFVHIQTQQSFSRVQQVLNSDECIKQLLAEGNWVNMVYMRVTCVVAKHEVKTQNSVTLKVLCGDTG